MSKKLKYSIKRLPKNSYVQARGKKGYVSKTNSKTKYILEVRDKTTKKVVGYINKKGPDGKPQSQIFKNRKNFLKTKARKKLVVQDSYTIKLHNKNYIVDQIRSKGAACVKGIKKHADKEKFCDVYCDLHLQDGAQLRSETRRFGRKSTESEIIEWIALIGVVNQVRNIGQRISPKKYARSDKEATRENNTKAILKVYLTNL